MFTEAMTLQTCIEHRMAKERSKAQWLVHRAAFAEARRLGANFHAATLAGFKATDEMDITKKSWHLSESIPVYQAR
jgi:hypothetical protein